MSFRKKKTRTSVVYSIEMDKYTEVKEIGQGAFGRAIHVKLKTTQEDFVIKKIRSELMTAKSKLEATKEVDVLKQLHHDNIVSYIESFEERGCLHIVMTYCSEGNLAVKIWKRRNNLFSEQEIITTFRQLCQAVEYMHSKNILHRDIKPENIFLTSSGIVKLGDFGLSRVLDTTMQYARTLAGTLCYMSPEILNGKQYKNKSDMWSLGCVLYELTALKRAFLSIASVISGTISPVPSSYSEDLHDLISVLLSTNPESRPSASDILSMRFIKPETDKSKISETSVISDLDLFLIGGHGHGRSATGNTILGIHGAFQESIQFEADESLVTDVKWCKRGHLILKLVDGPCLMEGHSSSRYINHAFVHCTRGFHALLFVLNFASPRLTAEDNFLIMFLKQNLGKDVFKDHGILVFTHGECFDLYTSHREWMTFDTWCDKQEGTLGDLIKECRKRVVLFYNLTPKKHEESVNKLITQARGIDTFFTCDFLTGLTKHGDKKHAVPEEVLCRLDLCLNDLRKYLESQALSEYQRLRTTAINLLAEISCHEQTPHLIGLQSLVSPLTGSDKITVQKLHDTLFDLQKFQAPYKRITLRKSHEVSRCSIA